jgi:LPXTG-site transpeptidase (sortase) family protein
MGRTALVLIAALAVGASAGFFVHDGMAREADTTTGAVPSFSANASLPGLYPVALSEPAKPRPRLIPSTISIPRLHLESKVFAASHLNQGPAWWPITGRPGGGDTIAIAGHRITHSHPFYYLERLEVGDSISIEYRGRAYRYRVSARRVVSAENLHIADAVSHERLLLTACTPRGSARSRLVVEALPS